MFRLDQLAHYYYYYSSSFCISLICIVSYSVVIAVQITCSIKILLLYIKYNTTSPNNNNNYYDQQLSITTIFRRPVVTEETTPPSHLYIYELNAKPPSIHLMMIVATMSNHHHRQYLSIDHHLVCWFHLLHIGQTEVSE